LTDDKDDKKAAAAALLADNVVSAQGAWAVHKDAKSGIHASSTRAVQRP